MFMPVVNAPPRGGPFLDRGAEKIGGTTVGDTPVDQDVGVDEPGMGESSSLSLVQIGVPSVPPILMGVLGWKISRILAWGVEIHEIGELVIGKWLGWLALCCLLILWLLIWQATGPLRTSWLRTIRRM